MENTNKLNDYWLLKIPFANKKYLQYAGDNTDGGINGYAFYLFDKSNKIHRQYIQLEKCSFRITDYDHVRNKQTFWYKRWKHLREKYLDDMTCINPYSMQPKQRIYHNMSKDEISYINEVLMGDEFATTVLNAYSFFSGSNPAGAESNFKASPIKCNDAVFWNCNFTNPLKTLKLTNKEKRRNGYIFQQIDTAKIKTLELSDILEDSTNTLKSLFEKYNGIWHNEALKFTSLKQTTISDIRIEIDQYHTFFKFPENQILYLQSYLNNKLVNIDQDEKCIQNNLRRFYASNVDTCLKSFKIPRQFLTKKVSEDCIENAHIIPFKFNDNKHNFVKLKLIIDPYNCLRIDANAHTLLDKKSIYFNENGDIVDLKGQSRGTQRYLDMNIIPNCTKTLMKIYENSILKTVKV